MTEFNWDDYVFIDTETTGLDSNGDMLLELTYAVGLNDPVTLYPEFDGYSFAEVSPAAMRVNKWFDRFPAEGSGSEFVVPADLATGPTTGNVFFDTPVGALFLDLPKPSTNEDWDTFLAAIKGKYWVGANPAFDVAFVRNLVDPEPLGHSHRLFDIQMYWAGMHRLPHGESFKNIVNGINDSLVEDLSSDRLLTPGDHTSLGDVLSTRLAFAFMMDVEEYENLWDAEHSPNEY